MNIVLLSAVTLVPVKEDRSLLTPDKLRKLLLDLRVETDRIEHIKVIDQAGLMWIGAYVAVGDGKSAQRRLHELCVRVIDRIHGWDVMRYPDL